jgi:mannose-1-phosphate guanylyltransferase / phosphomannomutase
MKTLLLANSITPELAPLTDLTCAAMLRVAGKPLLVYAIESLAGARLTDVIVVVSGFADHVERTLGDGARWGMHFHYVTVRGNDCPDALIRQHCDGSGKGLLIVRGEMLRTPIIAEFLARAASTAAAQAATIKGLPAGVILMHAPPADRHQACALLGLPRNRRNQALRSEVGASIDFPEGRLSFVESLRDFHRANLDAAAGRFPGLIIAGRELTPGVTVGRKTRLPASAIRAHRSSWAHDAASPPMPNSCRRSSSLAMS